MAQAPRKGGLLSSIPGMVRGAGERAGGILSGLGQTTTDLRRQAAGSGLLGGLIGAANAAIGSDAYTNAVNERERRQKEAEAAALEAQAMQARLGGLFGAGVQIPVPVMRPPDGAPSALPQPTAGPAQPQPTGPVYDENGVELITVQGGAVRQPSPPAAPWRPNYMAEAQVRYERGDYAGAARVLQEGQALEQQLQTQTRERELEDAGRVGAFLAPSIRMPVGTDQASLALAETSIENAMTAARAAGIVVPPAVENVLLDRDIPLQDRIRYLQGLAMAADPAAVARESAQLGFAPLDTVDLGNSVGVFDGRTGTITPGAPRGINPNNQLAAETARRGQDMQLRIAREQAASRMRIAQIQASTTMSEGEKNRAIRREQMASAERIAVITGRTIGEGEELGAYIDNPEF